MGKDKNSTKRKDHVDNLFEKVTTIMNRVFHRWRVVALIKVSQRGSTKFIFLQNSLKSVDRYRYLAFDLETKNFKEFMVITDLHFSCNLPIANRYLNFINQSELMSYEEIKEIIDNRFRYFYYIKMDGIHMDLATKSKLPYSEIKNILKKYKIKPVHLDLNGYLKNTK